MLGKERNGLKDHPEESLMNNCYADRFLVRSGASLLAKVPHRAHDKRCRNMIGRIQSLP
jgi:hypothetical protein